MPDDFQEGTYRKRRGKMQIVGKHINPTPSRKNSTPSRKNSTSSRKKLPSVEARHHGDQNDLGIDPDIAMLLDPTLPTVEEVRGSYGNVFFQSYTCLHHSLRNRARMIICDNGYPNE